MTENEKKSRKKNVRYTSPAGIAGYPRLTGEADTKFKAEGVWSTKLIFKSREEPGVDEMLTVLESKIAEAKVNASEDTDYIKGLKKKGKKLAECDRSFFVDEETGQVTVGFKMTASGISKKDSKPWSRRPGLFDRAGTPMDVETKLGSGSLLKVAFEAEPFYTALGYGCSIRLLAAQVLELVEWGGGNAESYGFGNEAQDEEEDTEQADEGSTEDTAGDDEDEKDF